ncbi:spidroin-1-like [Chiroxiphia lanceolata]|uniref:spidroin-1-like n=1 Tax=Chiroxiphia lanceolata TaxID=296741 RepID=UPI0013CE4FE4|nr:spidroin-1-like [Chiroxiphia lanceolata]
MRAERSATGGIREGSDRGDAGSAAGAKQSGEGPRDGRRSGPVGCGRWGGVERSGARSGVMWVERGPGDAGGAGRDREAGAGPEGCGRWGGAGPGGGSGAGEQEAGRSGTGGRDLRLFLHPAGHGALSEGRGACSPS